MEHLKMQTANKADENYRKLSELFPNAVTETIDENGEVVRAIDKDVLMQEIAVKVVDGREERYQFTWPDKKKSVLLANAPISKTLRPCREESVDFDNTENLYIEGDNLEVLKLLQETYLGKIKMVYIDPPYNTGNDFVYNDAFSVSSSEFSEKSGNFDEEGNQLVDNYTRNTESNGRFHTDWLNMIYPRLKLAKDLLKTDGVIYISIDDAEHDNLKKICDEIFGAPNFIADIIWKRKRGRDNSARWFSKAHEYCLVYAKNKGMFNTGYLELDDETKKAYKNPDNDPRGDYRMLGCWARGTQGGVKYAFTTKDGQFFKERLWLFSKENLEKLDKEDKLIIRGDNIYRKMFIYENKGKIPETLWDDVSNAANASDEIKKLFNGIVFDTPKPTPYIKRMIELSTSKDDIILDFFSGSATTANAVFTLNTEDGGHRKFIMVQLPEETDEKSEAYKAGYKNICEIGKERIRRAGRKVVESYQLSVGSCGKKVVESHQLSVDSCGKKVVESYQLSVDSCKGGKDGKLQRASSLAEVNGNGQGDLFSGEKTAEGRDLCTVGSDAASCGVDSVEHSGRTGTKLEERICTVSENSEGLQVGTGNSTADLQGNRLSDGNRNSEGNESSFGNRKNDNISNENSYNSQLKTGNYKLDVGFRVLKCDTSNMKDVYYRPDEVTQMTLGEQIDNIKGDRTSEDLLFQVMLDLGILLSSKIEETTIAGCKVFNVADGFLYACFDSNVSDEVVTAIAKEQPYYAVFRDSGMASDSVLTNFDQVFAAISPSTVRKVL